jgi:lipid-A-disaccharide synthase
MGISAVIGALPGIVRRAYRVIAAVVRARPDILVIIDSPEFTHAVARRVRRRLPGLPIVNYVSPTVWAWRPGRARRMRAYVDHVLALKPFEPAAHRRLGGPPCTYIGHPLVERLSELRPEPRERPSVEHAPLTLVVLPGSRRSEVERLMAPFGETLGRLAAETPRPIEVILPAVEHLAERIAALARGWPVPPRIVLGESEKYAAFRRAHLALAASGTVTLELALAGVPLVVAYKLSLLEAQFRRFVQVPSFVLTNLILGESVVPEHLQEDCTPDKLLAALRPLLADTPERRGQLEAFARLDQLLEVGAAHSPSERAAAIVASLAAEGRSRS